MLISVDSSHFRQDSDSDEGDTSRNDIAADSSSVDKVAVGNATTPAIQADDVAKLQLSADARPRRRTGPTCTDDLSPTSPRPLRFNAATVNDPEASDGTDDESDSKSPRPVRDPSPELTEEEKEAILVKNLCDYSKCRINSGNLNKTQTNKEYFIYI